MTRVAHLKGVCVLFVLAGCTGESGTLRVESVVPQLSGAPLTVGSDLIITRARLALSELEFEGGKDDVDEREAELGAAVVELDVEGNPTEIKAESVAAGSYHTVELELKAGGSGDAFADFRDGGNASILVEGTYQGNDFVFRSAISPELEFKIDPPVDVPANGNASVSVMFDLAEWFTSASGAVIDPTDGANQSTIDNNILDSMAAFATLEQGDDDGKKDD